MSRLVVAVMALAVVLVGGCVASPAAGGPAASPVITCTGLPTEKCDEAIKSVARSLPNEHPVAIDVTCASGVCSLANGFMDTVVTLAGGRQLRGSTLSWSDGTTNGGETGVPVPAPPLPGGPKPAVAPICQDVPAAQCNDMAASFSDTGKAAIVQILVRCTKIPCTEKNGDGDTVVTYADGTTSTGSWGYSSID